MTDLIKRLRDDEWGDYGELRREAADRIEELEAVLMSDSERSDLLAKEHYRDRIEELESDLALHHAENCEYGDRIEELEGVFRQIRSNMNKRAVDSFDYDNGEYQINGDTINMLVLDIADRDKRIEELERLLALYKHPESQAIATEILNERDKLRQRIEELEVAFATLQKFVDAQAEDAGLWCEAEYASEAYIQKGLRGCHAMIEQTGAALNKEQINQSMSREDKLVFAQLNKEQT